MDQWFTISNTVWYCCMNYAVLISAGCLWYIFFMLLLQWTLMRQFLSCSLGLIQICLEATCFLPFYVLMFPHGSGWHSWKAGFSTKEGISTPSSLSTKAWLRQCVCIWPRLRKHKPSAFYGYVTYKNTSPIFSVSALLCEDISCLNNF